LSKTNNQPDKFCRFCNDKIPRKLTNWYRRIACEKEECQEKKLEEIKEKARIRSRNNPKLTLNKQPYYKSQKIIGEFNGRKCVKCNKKLREPFRFRCPTCFTSASNSFYDFDSVNSRHKSSHVYE
jgi:hypothetical protein